VTAAAGRPSPAAPQAALEQLDRDLWVATRPLPMWIGDIGCRMSVLRLASGDLLLHSPVALDAATRDAVDGLGRVRWILGPSKVHHFHLGDWARAYPGAELCGVPGLAEKRRDLHFHRVVDARTASEPWGDGVRAVLFAGAPLMNELVLLHPSSRTLVLTDLAFNVRSRNEARLFHRLVGATGRFGPHRIARAGIRDEGAARRSLEEILAWDFDRVIVSHGDVLPAGGHAAMESAFSYLRDARPGR
jgi:hypothetical protein